LKLFENAREMMYLFVSEGMLMRNSNERERKKEHANERGKNNWLCGFVWRGTMFYRVSL